MFGVANIGSPRSMLNELARELFWLCLERRITNTMEWVPREENSMATEISKLVILDDWMPRRSLFRQLEQR